MAAGFFNALADPKRARAVSAGTRPAAAVHPEVVTAMREAGVDVSRAIPQYLSTDLAEDAHMLITMGCGDECPLVPGVERDDWPVDDPKDQPIERVREIRDAIRNRVDALIEERKWSR